MQDNRTAKKKLTDAIDAAQIRMGASFTASDIGRAAVETLNTETREELLIDMATTAAKRRVKLGIRKTDPRQGWLALPEYERIPQLIEAGDTFIDAGEATLDQWREAEARLEARIESYNYPRRRETRLKRDKEALSQMRKAERRAAPIIAENPNIRMGKALELYADRLREIAEKHTTSKKGPTAASY